MVAPVDAVGCGLHESIDKDVPADGHYDAAGERAQRSELGGSVVVLRENKGVSAEVAARSLLRFFSLGHHFSQGPGAITSLIKSS